MSIRILHRHCRFTHPLFTHNLTPSMVFQGFISSFPNRPTWPPHHSTKNQPNGKRLHRLRSTRLPQQHRSIQISTWVELDHECPITALEHCALSAACQRAAIETRNSIIVRTIKSSARSIPACSISSQIRGAGNALRRCKLRTGRRERRRMQSRRPRRMTMGRRARRSRNQTPGKRLQRAGDILRRRLRKISR